MSKVDDTLAKFAIQILGQSTGATSFGVEEFNVKQALYTDLVELIGEDEPNPFTETYDFNFPRKELEILTRNKYRAELRTKIKDYLGIE